VWPVCLAKAEAGAQVVNKVGFLLDSSKKRLVDLLLVLNTVLGGLLLLCICQYNSDARYAESRGTRCVVSADIGRVERKTLRAETHLDGLYDLCTSTFGSIMLTSGFSPCLKKASSPDFLEALSLVK